MTAKARLRLVERREAEGGWGSLAPEWQALPGTSLLGLPPGARPPERRVALLHPRHGLVILDVLGEEAAPLSPREAAATVVAVQARLCAAGFPLVFPGHLPVLHLALAEAALPALARRLEDAFRAIPGPTLREGDAWTGPLRRALTSAPGGVPLPGLVPPDRRRGLASRRWRRAGAAGLGVVGLGLMVALLAPRLPAAPFAASLAGEAGSDAPEMPAEADPLAAFDRALAALERSYRDETAGPVMLASLEAASPIDPPPETTPRLAIPEERELPLPKAGLAALMLASANPLPEPEARALPGQAAVPGAVEPVPEPEEARLPDPAAATLSAEAGQQAPAARVEPVPEPEAARLPEPAAATLSAEAGPSAPAARVEPVPEPEEARLPDPAAATLSAEAGPPAPATRVEPVPEPEEARLPDPAAATLSAEAGPSAPTARVEPVPEPEAARLPGAAAAVLAPEAAPAPPAMPAPPGVAAAPAAPRVAALDPTLVAALLARGQAMMARGDISAARLLFSRAAQAGSAEGAAAMARSFDAAVLAGLGARGIRPDQAQAEHWYRRAAELGATRRESP